LFGLYKDGNIEDTIYNKGYSLEAGRVDRIHRGPVELNEPCLVLLWFMQPDKIPTLFGNETLTQGGFLPRCLALHEHCEAQEITWKGKSVDKKIHEGYGQLWTALFDAYRMGGVCQAQCDPYNDHGDKDPKIEPRIVKLREDAKEFMTAYHNQLVPRINSDLKEVKAFVSRCAENACRLALAVVKAL
jgi:hypothetical protein